MDVKNFILNATHGNDIINFVTLCMKQYIFRCKCMDTKPNVKAVENEINYIQELEWFNAKKSCNMVKHIKKWCPVFPELSNVLNDEPLTL